MLALLLLSLPSVLYACSATSPAGLPVTGSPIGPSTTPAAGTTTVAGMTTSTSTASTTTSSSTSTTTSTTTTTPTPCNENMGSSVTDPNFRNFDMRTVDTVTMPNTMTVTCITTNPLGTNVVFAIVDANGQQPLGQFFGPPGPMVTYTLTCVGSDWTIDVAGMQIIVRDTACTIP